MSLLLVLGIFAAWLLIGLLACLGLCTSAAQGDRGQARANLVINGRRRRFERDLESAS